MSAASEEETRRIWKVAAERWKRDYPTFKVSSRAASDLIISAVGASDGMRVLDLASGTGQPALPLAQAVLPGGTVVATDLVPEMLSVAEENAAQETISNISFEVLSAEDLPFEDESFDAVTCRFGVMFVSDVESTMRGIRRVLKPGARAAFISWGPIEESPSWAVVRVIRDVALEEGLPKGAVEPILSPFRFDDLDKLRDALGTGGFESVEVSHHVLPWPSLSPPEELFERGMESPAVQNLFDLLEPDTQKRTREAIIDVFRRYFDGTRANFEASLNLGVGIR